MVYAAIHTTGGVIETCLDDRAEPPTTEKAVTSPTPSWTRLYYWEIPRMLHGVVRTKLDYVKCLSLKRETFVATVFRFK